MALPGFTAENSLYQTNEHYQLKDVQNNQVNGSSMSVYPSTIQGCFYGPSSYFDCEAYGSWGVTQNRWYFYQCLNRYCGIGNFALETYP